MRKLILIFTTTLIISCNSSEKDMIFHYSVLKALDNGVLEGNMKISELRKNGDLGIGTYNKLNGEMIILDGVVYRVSQDGKIYQPPDTMLIPYSIITFYRQERSIHVERKIDYPALKALTDSIIPSRNLFYAFRIKGDFEYIKCGGANRQERPYDKSLVQMLENRPVYEGRNASGTLVGFWCPEYIGDINTQGYHLHFLSDDLTVGGHVMEFIARSLNIGYDIKYNYKIMLPDTRDFKEKEFRKEAVNY